MNSAAEDQPSNSNEPIRSDDPSQPGDSTAPRDAQSSGCVTAILVAVIVILAVGLLLPAIRSTPPPKRVYQVKSEFERLSMAIMGFKARFGVPPPSTITLFRHHKGWMSPEGARSRRLLRQLWPQLNVADETFKFLPVEEVTLNGPECLVFFLSGRFKDGRPVGFSKDPTNPFRVDNSGRDGPFFEFRGGFNGQHFTDRFIDANNNRFPEYLSCLPGAKQPYLYVDLERPLSIVTLKQSLGGYMPDIYRSTPGDAGTPWNDGTYQLICASYDDEFGEGGFLKLEPDNFPNSNDRKFDRDNLTNFAWGPLETPPPRSQQLWQWICYPPLGLSASLGSVALLAYLLRKNQRVRPPRTSISS